MFKQKFDMRLRGELAAGRVQPVVLRAEAKPRFSLPRAFHMLYHL